MLILLAAVIFIHLNAVYAGEGTVNAFGCVYCKGRPLTNITVKMYDVDCKCHEFYHPEI
ncbi:unnamed protein product [Cylicostephanus goldi]|uniref:Uncharacterized protein n=1 Tax=Cylicostephanus goldi TaxID=71465 RepID=A0A3P6S6P3_CYLGO|nr:unnamed protein product [Cylicostephanus goldi]